MAVFVNLINFYGKVTQRDPVLWGMNFPFFYVYTPPGTLSKVSVDRDNNPLINGAG